MSSAFARALIAELDDEALDALAERLAPRVAATLAATNEDEWLDSAGAARHLCATRARIHDLVQLGRLEPRRDGRRLLFRASDLNAYLEERDLMRG